MIPLFIDFGFFDVLDILMVAFIIYQVYRLVKGTAAMNILVGIFLVGLLWLLVRASNMVLMTSIMSKFVEVGVIALLIVFQQEVRRFLLLMGSKYNIQNIISLEGLFVKPDIQEDVSEAIVDACDYFSATQTGALIVIAQNTELFSYAQSGVLLRSKVTTELLESIFFKNSPLHDGAVIISDNKILAARCILPVSDRTNLPGSMGLRHRAALGLSAVSDALVVIVSEETGNITFVKEGNYQVRVTPDNLRRYLHKELSGFVVR